MKNRFVRIGLAVILGFGSIVLLVGLVTYQAQATPDALKMQQVNEDGFGDIMNKLVPSLAIFGDYLYAGTWRYDELGDILPLSGVPPMGRIGKWWTIDRSMALRT